MSYDLLQWCLTHVVFNVWFHNFCILNDLIFAYLLNLISDIYRIWFWITMMANNMLCDVTYLFSQWNTYIEYKSMTQPWLSRQFFLELYVALFQYKPHIGTKCTMYTLLQAQRKVKKCLGDPVVIKVHCGFASVRAKN